MTEHTRAKTRMLSSFNFSANDSKSIQTLNITLFPSTTCGSPCCAHWHALNIVLCLYTGLRRPNGFSTARYVARYHIRHAPKPPSRHSIRLTDSL